MKVQCNRCGYVAEESEFPTGRDFFQKPYIKSCPKKCGNTQNPGDASLRMMPGMEHPFSYIRADVSKTVRDKVFHEASEAS
jgi:hypothetical protein